MSVQKYGDAKRENHIIMEMVRFMIVDTNLDNCYWVEIINIVVKILIRSPKIPLVDTTPYKAWLWKKPSITYL